MSTTRVKDAGFLQKNIEKLLFAAGALILIITLLLFILGNPFKIEVGGTKVGTATEAVAKLEAADDSLKAGLNDTTPFEQVPPTPDFLIDYQAMLEQSVNSPQGVARLSKGGLTYQAINPDIPEPPRYAMVYPPAPKNVEYKFGTDVLDVEFNQQIADAYFELWGEQREPADFSMIVVAGDFDIWEWVNRLKAEDASPADGNKIPVGIWGNRFGIAATALLREEWDPGKGVWTNRVIVPALPGQARLLPTDPAPSSPVEALVKVQQLREAQADIARPEMPWVTGFIQIEAPGGDRVGDGAAGFDEFGRELDDAVLGPNEQKIKDLEEDIKELEEKRRAIEERNRPRDDRPDRPDRPRRDGGDDFGDPGDFDAPPDRSERRDPIQRQIDRLQEEIERRRPEAEKEREERTKQAELRRIREAEARRRLEEQRLKNPDAFIDPEFASGLDFQGVELREGATVRVWAADPTMQPGKTYRYKLLVAAINPLYAVPRLESEQLAENKTRAAIFPTEKEIEAMPWISPIKVEPRARFFFTSGGESRAKIDIYRRHEGKLYGQGFDVSPGDPIGGVVTIKDKKDLFDPFDVNMSVGAVLIDIEARRTVSGKTDYVMIYMDKDGTIYERSQTDDASDSAKRDLDKEVKDGPTWTLRPELPKEDRFDDFGGGGFDGF